VYVVVGFDDYVIWYVVDVEVWLGVLVDVLYMVCDLVWLVGG